MNDNNNRHSLNEIDDINNDAHEDDLTNISTKGDEKGWHNCISLRS